MPFRNEKPVAVFPHATHPGQTIIITVTIRCGVIANQTGDDSEEAILQDRERHRLHAG